MKVISFVALLLPILLFAALACGGSEAVPTPVPASTPAPTTPPTTAPAPAQPSPTATAEPTEALSATPTPEPAATPTVVGSPTEVATPDPTSTPQPTETPEPTLSPEPEPTATPEPSEVLAGPGSFIVGEGSKITFTVEEELNFSPVRFDAVISSTGLGGVANLDGSPSEITLDLHSLKSDQSFRDRYIRQRMFPGTPTATVVVNQLPDLPQSFFDGEETSGTLDGALQIGDTVTPLTFDVTARHDGSVINVLAKTTFTWDELGLATPVAGPVVYLADEVRVQVLIIAHAQ